MKRCFTILLVVFFSWFILPKSCLSQSGEVVYIYPQKAIYVGTGPSFEQTVNYAINLEWISHFGLIMGRVTRVNKDAFYARSKPAERNADLALMYGWRHFFRPDQNNALLSISLATGIAFTRFIRQTDEIKDEGDQNPACLWCRSTFKTNNQHMPGGAVELRFTLIEKDDSKGLSFGLWYNFNRLENFGGFVVSLYILRG
ncbi:MAG: hypothetical protein AB8G77_03110 [Rhodothermales bacterium]